MPTQLNFEHYFLVSAAAIIVGLSAWAQNPQSGSLSPPAGESVLQPKCACADLRSLTGYEFTVESAAVIPASADVPEHCRVRGQILPELRFEVSLPAVWN